MKMKFNKMSFYISVLLFLALMVGLAIPAQSVQAVAPVVPVVLVYNLQPSWTAPGSGGVFAAYIGPPAYDYVSPGTTAVYDGREAGIIKAGINVDVDGHYWDEGLFGFKPTVTINTFAAGTLTYDVENQAGVNPVWMTIEIDTGVVGDRSDNTTYQHVPTMNPAGWHTVDAAAGLWQKWNDNNGDVTGNPLISLSQVALDNAGLDVVRAYLRLGMGDSYNNGGTGTIAWVDKATIAGVAYDFVIRPELLTPLDGAILHYNQPTFDWVDFPGAIGYQIQVSKNNTFSLLVLNKLAVASTYTATTSLPANTLLYWRVRARVGMTYSAWSEIRTFTTANPPSVPNLTAPAYNTLIAGPSPLFDWNNSTVPAGVTFDHYQIQIATDNAFTAVIHDLNIAGITNSQDGTAVLPAGATYYWRVRSFNTAGDYSAWSLVRSVRIKFDAPTLLLPANTSTIGSLLPTFTWSTASGATSYTLQVSKVNTFASLVIFKTIAAPTYTATTSLTAATTYYWRVKVNGPCGPSAWSVTFSFTTP